MNIWIVTIGEPIINNKNNLRLHRHGLLAEYISKHSTNKVIGGHQNLTTLQKSLKSLKVMNIIQIVTLL